MVTATGASKVAIDPAMTVDPTKGPGTQLVIDITIEDVMNLWGYQFWLKFNPNVLQGVSVEDGPFLGKSTNPKRHPVVVAPGPGFDNEAGELKLFGAVIYFEVNPPHNRYLADGSGVLATVTFNVTDWGCSYLFLGPETAVVDKRPGVLPEIEYYLEHGYFTNLSAEELDAVGPELYVRGRGAHGSSGTWPEWHVGLSNWYQTLYCRIMNYGEMGAWVEVEFIVTGPGGVEILRTEQVWIGPATWVADEIVPAEVTVSAYFMPEIVGKYHVSVMLYFIPGCAGEKEPWMPHYAYYPEFQEILGGEGLSRDMSVAFKVQEHI
jgi:hypothetical protein